MAWFAANWFWALIFIALIARYLSSHGGHDRGHRERSGDEMENTMACHFGFVRKLGGMASVYLIALATWGFPAHGQESPQNNAPPAMGPNGDGQADKMGKDEEVAHPFFTHMGMPEAVGVFNLRLAGLATRVDGHTKGDFGFHFETGLTKSIGLHVRNDRFLDKPRTEVMFQFAALRSKDGMSGFSPIIEFEFPTRSGDGKRINTLVGFSTALTNSNISFNQVLHYNPREDLVDGSAALVFKVGNRYHPVLEVLAEAMRGDRPIVNVLLGLKVRVNESLLLGLAFQIPTTSRKDFSSQMVFQPDREWRLTR